MQLLQEQWEGFLKQCYPGGVTEEQRKQLHRAFFAGALAYWSELQAVTNMPNDQAEQVVTALEQEILQHCTEIITTNKARN